MKGEIQDKEGIGLGLAVGNRLFQERKYEEALAVYMGLAERSEFSKLVQANIELTKRRIARQLAGDGAAPVVPNAKGVSLLKTQSVDINPAKEGSPAVEFGFKDLCSVAPILSVVIPAFNAEKYLNSVVESLVLSATIPLEVIIVDDGSTDKTPSIGKTLAEKYYNVAFYQQVNRGAGVARNFAIDKCRGRYAYFLDADDSVNCAELCKSVMFAMQSGAELIFVPYQICYVEKDRVEPMYPNDEQIYRKFLAASGFVSERKEVLNLTGFPWNRIIETKLLRKKRILFGSSKVHNDVRFHWQSVCLSERIVFWHKVVCIHRKFASGTLSSNRGIERLAVFDAISETVESLKDNKFFLENIGLWEAETDRVLEWNLKNLNKDAVPSFQKKLKEYKESKKQRPVVDVGQSGKGNRVTKKGKVSVITVTWNILGDRDDERRKNANHFAEMFESVLRQSYGRSNIEHVVIDGASTDGTLEILEQLKKEKVIDRLISEPDSGIYNAMNKGVRNATGDYVVFLNAHDKLEVSAISFLVKAIESANVDYAFGNSVTINEGGVPIGRHVGDIDRIYFGMPYCHQAAAFKRSTFEKVPFPEDFRITTWRYALNLHLAGFRHAYIPATMAYFREGGVSTNAKGKEVFLGELKRIKMEVAKHLLNIPYKAYESLRSMAGGSKVADESVVKEVLRMKSVDSEIVEDFLYRLSSCVARA